MNTKGTTILEVLIAVVIVTISVASLSLVYPKASKSISTSRQRLFATNFASARMQQLTQSTYSYIPPTDPNASYFGYTGGTSLTGGCDCTRADFSAIPPDASDSTPVMSEGGVAYSRRTCVHFVDRSATATSWNSFCPDNPLTDAADHGLKSVLVRVFWTQGGTEYHTDVDTMVTR